MKTCFIHVGPHKTGSTSIQRFIRHNEAALLKNNLDYVSLASSKKFSVNLFFPENLARIQAGEAKGLAWKAMKQFLKGDKDLFISDERLSRQLSRPDFLPELSVLFGKYGFRLVLMSVFREQAGHFNSSYVQAVKRFIVKTDIESYIAAEMSSLRYSPRQVQAVADAAAIEYRPVSFENAVNTSTLTEEFVRAMGMDAADFDEPVDTARNLNPGVLTIAAAERLRAVFPDVSDAREDNDAYKDFQIYFKEKDWEKEPYFGVSEPLQREIYDRFFEENDSFTRKTLGKGWDEVAPFRLRPVNARSYESLSDEERRDVDVIVDMLVRKFSWAEQ